MEKKSNTFNDNQKYCNDFNDEIKNYTNIKV